MADPAEVTYSSYLRLDELLDLQTLLSEDEHDEMLFIVVHQVYELWFKQIRHETDRIQHLLAADEDARVRHALNRVLAILKVLVHQLDILETMTPLEFLTFRNRLASSSGFQSWQFRAFEMSLGYKRRASVDHYEEGTPARELLERMFAQPTLWDAFLAYLHRRGYAVPETALSRDVSASVESSPELQAVLIDVYRSDDAVRELCERLVDLDEGIQEWRYRHVKMVERTIGFKRGTGGSAGAEYLRSTLFRPVFPDLWEIRTEL